LPASIPRIAAALIALACWVGIALQFSATYGHTGDVLLTVWTLARFFTIITNLGVAIVMTGVAFGRRVSPFLIGGLTLAILLVGIVYVVLLRGLHPLAGAALIADYLLHYVSPVAMAAFWLLLTPHGRLRWRDPLWWGAYPLAYFLYVIARGATDGRYPYPFIDVGKIGVGQTLINAIAIALGFVVCGFLVVWVDRLLGHSRSTG
jgi:hypothetical protein